MAYFLLHVQGKYQAALTPIELRLTLTLDRAVGYHQVQEGLLSPSGAVELVKMSKLH